RSSFSTSTTRTAKGASARSRSCGLAPSRGRAKPFGATSTTVRRAATRIPESSGASTSIPGVAQTEPHTQLSEIDIGPFRVAREWYRLGREHSAAEQHAADPRGDAAPLHDRGCLALV